MVIMQVLLVMTNFMSHLSARQISHLNLAGHTQHVYISQVQTLVVANPDYLINLIT